MSSTFRHYFLMGAVFIASIAAGYGVAQAVDEPVPPADQQDAGQTPAGEAAGDAPGEPSAETTAEAPAPAKEEKKEEEEEEEKEKIPAKYADFATNFDVFEVFDPPYVAPTLTFYDLKDRPVQLSELKGQWRLINFWATWCAPCITELPQLVELEKSRKKMGLDVIYVSMDRIEDIKEFRKTMKKVGIPKQVDTLYVTGTETWSRIGLESLPTTVIMSPDGRFYYKLVGSPDWAAPESLAFIDDLFKNDATGAPP